MTSDEGQRIVREGLLPGLREHLGVSRNTMAELLHVSPYTYRRWETDSTVAITKKLAERLSLFYWTVIKELESLAVEDIDIAGMMPLHMVAVYLSLPQEVIMERYRSGAIQAEDLGVLGLWVKRADYDA